MASPASARSFVMRGEFLQLALAGRTRDIAAHYLAKGFEFEDCGAGSHWACLYFRRLRNALSITARVPSVICIVDSSFSRIHATCDTSSPAQSVPPVILHT